MTKKYNYHYTYMITNLNNHKRYVGVRSCNCYPTEDITYMSSCKNLKETINKEGKMWFKKNILAIWETRDLAVEHEIRLHNYFEVGINPMFYNQVKQACNGFDCTGCKRKHTPESIEKMKLTSTGKYHSEETKEKIKFLTGGKNNGMYGKKHTSITKEKMIKNNSGKYPSSETRKKMSLKQKEKLPINKNGEIKRIKKEELKYYKDKGWKEGTGYKRTKQQKDKQSYLMLTNNPFKGKKHSEETRKKMSENHADFSGKNHPLYGKKRPNISEKRKGKKCINKNGENKFINKEEFDFYLKDGWELGMYKKGK